MCFSGRRASLNCCFKLYKLDENCADEKIQREVPQNVLIPITFRPFQVFESLFNVKVEK